MRLIKEVTECLPKICHNIALISTELYYVLFKRIDALEAEIDELRVFLNYDIDGLKEINRYYREVADKVKDFSVSTNLYTGAINDLINGQRAIDTILDSYKEDLNEPIDETTAVYPENILEPEPEVIKSEEAVKELNAEADAIAEAKSKEIEAKRQALAEAQNKQAALKKQAEEAKKNIAELEASLAKAKEEANKYTETLEAEAARGTPASYVDTPFGAVRTDGTFGGVITKFAEEESIIKGEEARIIEGVIEKTGEAIDRAINVAAGYEDVKGVLERGGTYEEALEVAKDNLSPASGFGKLLTNASIEEEAAALVQTVQERIDVENAAASITGATEKIESLQNQMAEEKAKYEKTMEEVYKAQSEVSSLSDSVSRDASAAVREMENDGSSGGGGEGGSERPERENPREGGESGYDRAKEKEERDREKAYEHFEKDLHDNWDDYHFGD